MSVYRVVGGNRLQGEIKVEGSKNAVLPILAATVLNKGESIIENVPELNDVITMLRILESLGCRVEYKDQSVWVDASNITSSEMPANLVKQMRSSIILLGSLLGRTGRVVSTYPGGCAIGVRPIDLHLKGLRRLGAKIDMQGQIVCEGETLKGTEIQLDYPSVGATENIMLAAVLAKGTTIIRNAAKEPEIVDLQDFLNSMGAKVYGSGNHIIRIEGVGKLHSTRYSVIPDRIAAGTYMAAAAVTGGTVLLKDVVVEHLHPLIDKFKESGCEIETNCTRLRISAPKQIKAIELVRTLPYPGFPTDAQPQMMAAMCTAQGTSIFVENIFENRYRHVDELTKMGADIKVDGRIAVVKGVRRLNGTTVLAKDLRGGAALVLAGMVAEGTTVIEGVEHIDRGYEELGNKLKSLGADITVI
ncbi:MAG: UDP-N-acetylglucosamine 1-carboxyvinyltransferase [Firmicutes bacterium]|nr:UDP-N-acetylglucosamine 1-carboxyvinyltransferase [Bacillota bacterium]MDI6706321.1 UDP-N-acetylglucosamine 1-carboxyvinyltransferase [Bacillota bacterium]